MAIAVGNEMKILANCIVIAVSLAGCGGSQPPIGAPGATAQTPVVDLRASSPRSLIYIASKRQSLVHIMTYPSGDRVGVLKLTKPASALCADRAGNVWVALNGESQSSLIEYAHAGTTPIATLRLDGYDVSSCSVDPLTGNLAVAYGTFYVAIYPNATGTPIINGTSSWIVSVTYDNNGDLFAYCRGTSSRRILAELAYGASYFNNMQMTQNIDEVTFAQWDGTAVAVAGISGRIKTAKETIYRLVVSGSSLKTIGTVVLDPSGSFGFGPYAYIYRRKLIQPISSGRIANEYDYPKGGFSKGTFAGPDLKKISAITISVAQ